LEAVGCLVAATGFLVEEEALEDGQGREGEHGEEEGRDDIGNYADNNAGEDG